LQPIRGTFGQKATSPSQMTEFPSLCPSSLKMAAQSLISGGKNQEIQPSSLPTIYASRLSVNKTPTGFDTPHDAQLGHFTGFGGFFRPLLP
jgi:hypothetical protein